MPAMTIRKSPSHASASVSAPGHLESDVLRFDDAPEFMESAPLDDVDHKVKAAQEQLLQLRMQQEEIERQKQHLETLRVKQERFVAGKRDLLEKLSRSVSSVERDLYDAQKRVEELSLTHDDFRRHLDILKSLQPEKWHRSQVDEELDQALAAIEDAEADFAKGVRRLESLRIVESNPIAACVSHKTTSVIEESTFEATMTCSSPTEEMIVWMRRGFAFTLPLIGSLLLGLLLAKLMF
jgi:predicted RNase H-like nuclease (RuvC/YqgF family)